MFRSLLRAIGICILLSGTAAHAAPPVESAIPASLNDWRAWVLKDLDFRACPFLSTQMQADAAGHICAWPGRLAIDAGNDGATFSVHWRVDAAGWIELPGDAQHWPQQVTLNKQRQPVLARGSIPAVWLVPGSYDIAGTIPWHERPQSLRVPGGVGLLALTVDGKIVVPIQREGEEMTLGRSATTAPEADSLDVHVFRELADTIPGQLTTQIRLVVSGQSREETLGPALPQGFEATALDGEWPARLDSDSRLHVQVQPGSATLTLRARALAPMSEIIARLPATSWPKQEIWSYEAVPRLRVTSVSAAVAVDPHQAQVPDEWSTLPAFALGDGDKLTLEERSRGLAPNEANRLNLRREAWLDFAGDGWYSRDYLSGSMVQGWRLDVAAPLALERAEANASRRGSGGNEALLVTHGATPELSGVEWRTPMVDVEGSVRIASTTVLPAGGWQQTFDSINTTLHFPFGYKLLGAPGADTVYGSWMSNWSLLDVFIAAILVLLAWRLLGALGALGAAIYLLLGYQESGSPLWTLLAVFALSLIARVLPVGGKLQRATEWSRRFALLLLVIVALPFLANQVRYALYPQLEAELGYVTPSVSNGGLYRYKLHSTMPAQYQAAETTVAAGGIAQNAPVASPPPPPPPAMPLPMKRAAPKIIEKVKPPSEPASVREDKSAGAAKDDLQSITVTGSNIQKSQLIDHYSQSTVMQTGAGEPSWNLGSSAMLGWSGPVLPTQNVRLLIAPPWLVRPLRLVLAALLFWIAWRAFRSAQPSRRIGRTVAAGFSGVLLAAGIAFALAAPSQVQAQNYPGDELLQQLRERLTEEPKCAPACASIAQVQVAANGDAVSVVLEVHAGERLALPLPVIDATASLKSIKVDGGADASVARVGTDAIWIALDRGVHRVEIDYAAYADKFSLSFALVPARALFDGKGWSASGIEDERLLSGTLSLARARDATAGKPMLGVQQFPPYVRVDRSLSLGLDWSVSTSVQRLSPATGGFTLSLPLLAGEHVSSAGLKVQNGNATVALGDNAASADWNSTLDRGDSLILSTPALADRTEVWHVLVSPTWHVEFSGVPGVGLDAGEDASDYRNFEFHPLPGEKLTLKITRPAPLQGAVRAIDGVKLSSEAGQRSAAHTLRISMRASQGGEQTVRLPKDAEVISVKRDNETLNLRAQDGKLSLPVKPGAQFFEIQMRDSTALDWIVRTPQIGLGLPAANIQIDQQLAGDRWLLATFGPPVGPAVLYWGELVVMLAIAYALARTRRTRLKFHDWLLLGLGFSTFSWIALLVVVAWLFAFDWRARVMPSPSWWRFNVSQAALVVLTGIALICLIAAIPQGLLGQPDMHVTGNASTAQSLRWFADRSTDALPQASAISLPLWVYKLLMLAWALWLANALIGWLRDGFAAWTRGGYWQPRVSIATAPDATPAAPVTDVAKA